MTKLTVEMQGENGRRFAIDHEIDEREILLYRGRKVSFAFDGARIRLPVELLQRLLHTVDTAERSGSEYPEDWKGFYGLEKAPGER